MKTFSIKLLFWLYFILVVAAIVSYTIWLVSLDQEYNKTFEIVMIILVGLVFLLSLYLYSAYDTIVCPGITIFLAFGAIMAYTFINSRIETDRIYRKTAYTLGLLSVIPVMLSYILNKVNNPISPDSLGLE